MIVARGLGRGVGAVLVTAGLGLATTPAVTPPPAPHPMELLAGGSGWVREIRDERPHVDPQIRRNNEAIIAAAIAMITQGLLE